MSGPQWSRNELGCPPPPLVQVAAVPTVLGFREGRVQGQFVGDQSPEFVEDFVKKLVSGGSS